MIVTIPATNIGAADNGCAVVTLFSNNAQQKIEALLAELSRELDGIIWTMPPASLHSTLCEIIQPKPYTEDKDTIYQAHTGEYQAVLDDVLKKFGPIKVHFNKIEASQHAIVVMAEDGGIFNQIRAELVKKLPFPAETKSPPDVVHSSIARYTKEIDLATVEAAVARHAISFEEIVTEFQLLYPIWPHLLHYDIVKKYPLVK